jgi:hypothetical protein
MVFLTLVSMNKPVKIEFKTKHTYFYIFLLFFILKKKHVSYARFTFHSKNPRINYIVKSLKKKHKELTNKFRKA